MIFSLCDSNRVLEKTEAATFADAAIKFAAGRRYAYQDFGQLDLSERCGEGIVDLSVDGSLRRIISAGYLSEHGLHTHGL